jgi:hypothetical protein
MIDEVVAGEDVDLVGVAGEMSDGDRDHLAVARGLREGGGPVEQIAGNRREHCRGHHGGHVVTGLGPLDDAGDSGVAAHGQLVDDVLGFGGHGRSVGGTPDTALSREVGRTLRW